MISMESNREVIEILCKRVQKEECDNIIVHTERAERNPLHPQAYPEVAQSHHYRNVEHIDQWENAGLH